jgi:hypothetical protein
MLSPEQLKLNILGGNNDPEGDLVLTIAIMMMELNLSYEEVMNLPIPAFSELNKALLKIKKEQNKPRR